MIKAGADSNIGNKHGQTPLWFAVLHGEEDVVKCLLEGRADVTVRTVGSGQTALWLSGQKGSGKTEELLKLYGAVE